MNNLIIVTMWCPSNCFVLCHYNCKTGCEKWHVHVHKYFSNWSFGQIVENIWNYLYSYPCILYSWLPFYIYLLWQLYFKSWWQYMNNMWFWLNNYKTHACTLSFVYTEAYITHTISPVQYDLVLGGQRLTLLKMTSNIVMILWVIKARGDNSPEASKYMYFHLSL